MKITYTDKTLLESCSFLTLGLGETRVQIGESDLETLTFVFDFMKDDSVKEANFKTVKIDNKTLKLELKNMNSSLGTTLKKEILVGTFKKRKLFMIFLVAKAGQFEEIRLVTVSFYLGEEVPDGSNQR